MPIDNLNIFDSYGKESVAAAKDLLAINSKIMQEVFESQVGFINLCVEGSEAQLDAVKDISDLKTFMAKETELVEGYAAKVTDSVQSNVKLAQKAADQYKAWFEKGLKTADSAMKDVAKTAMA